MIKFSPKKVTTDETELDLLYEDDMIYDEIDNIEENDKNRELNSDDEDFDEERLPAIETEIIRDEDQEQCVIWVVF